MESRDIIIGLIGLAVAQFAALAAAYAKIIRRVATMGGEVKYFTHQIDKLEARVIDQDHDLSSIDRGQIKNAMDLNHAFEKIRELEDLTDKGA